MKTYRSLALALAVLVSLGCASISPAQTLLVSGESINATGELFVNTTKLLTPPCNAHTLPNWAVVCPAFKTFGQKFQEAWPMATGLWYAARKANDPNLQAPAEAAIKALRTELNAFALGGK
jgi:hypothetical protein